MKNSALILLILLSGCTSLSVPKIENWGIYSLDLGSKKADLIYSSAEKLTGVSVKDNLFAFEMNEEIYTYNKNSKVLAQLTNNTYLDTYPIFSPNGLKLAYLSMNNTLDIRVMNVDGSDDELLYDSGFHDADISWINDKIVFTRNSRVWIMDDSGFNAKQLTNYSEAEVWGKANLPFGDYDPRISHDGSKIVFERLLDDVSVHGNYDLFLINVDGSNEARLTNTGYSQGLASWSPNDKKLVYSVAAINDSGAFDLYMINIDGSNNKNITPDYFPSNFLIQSSLFYSDNLIYFIGQWWE